MSPTRPALRWHGGKWRLAPWIIAHFPAHRGYVEPFGGGASVLLRKARSYAEVYNDLDDWAVNLFRVLRDPKLARKLIKALRLTPFARSEFAQCGRMIEKTDDPVEMARRLVVRSFMGFGSNAHNGRATGFRSNSNRSGTTPAHDWAHYPDALAAVCERMQGVVIENRDASEIMTIHDGPEVLHYIDPPYLPETRSPANKYDLKYRMYRHEMTREEHAALLNHLRTLSGMVVLSGYPAQLYDDALDGWRRVETRAHADGARERTEVLWLNRACTAALGHGPLFEVAA